MALKDCIDKLGGAVTDEDAAKLTEYLEAGFSDEDAVRALLLEARRDSINLLIAAKEAGAEIQAPTNVVATLTRSQEKIRLGIVKERATVLAEMAEITEQLNDISTVLMLIQARRQGEKLVDITDDQALLTELSSLLFEQREGLREGVVGGLKGTTPLALLKSFREMQAREPVLTEKMQALAAISNRLEERERFMVGPRPKEFFQGGREELLRELRKLKPGSEVLRKFDVLAQLEDEALVNAARLIPAEGSASAMLKALIRQPGVKQEALDRSGLAERLGAGAVTREEILDILQPRTFFQTGGERGAIRFNERQQATIRLFEARDLSTFLHESGHLYLELLGDLAERPEAATQTKADFAKILTFLGVQRREDIRTPQHEKFADSFLAYLEEGKAPDVGLQDIFNAFRSWLTNLYKRNPLPELSQDVRGVFDRLVATDQAIADAEQTQQYAALYATAEDMGVSPEAFAVYRRRMQDAHQQAVDKETEKQLRYMRREAQKWWNDELRKMRAVVEEETHAMPVYRAISMLKSGSQPDGSPTQMAPFKLDRDDLIDRYGKEFIKQLPGRGKSGMYRVEGGVDLDQAAKIFGFDSGDALVRSILKAPDMAGFIEAESRRRLDVLFPDPAVDGTLADGAVVAVHNEKRAQILAAEMRALSKGMKEDKAIVSATQREAARTAREARQANEGTLPKRGELATIKAAAKRIIAGQRIRDIAPNKYLQAERKAGNLAFKAAAKQDFQTAYLEKRKQLVNHEMYRAAVRANTEATRTRTYLKKFESRKEQRKLGRSGLLEKILTVIEGIDLRKISLAQVDRDKAMAEMAEQVKSGELVTAVLNEIGTNWQDLTAEEFAGMRDIVKQLEAMAKKEVEGIVNGEKVIHEEKALEVAESIAAAGEVTEALIGKNSGQLARAKQLKVGAISAWLRPSSIARVLDGATFGAVTRNIIVPMRRAYAEQLIPRMHTALQEVADIYKEHYSMIELQRLNMQQIHIESMGQSLTKGQMIALALNNGSESNRQALLGGIKRDGNQAYSQATINEILSKLSDQDYNFIEAVWTHLDGYWTEIAATERRRRGIAPDKVDPSPFRVVTSDGTERLIPGGYYPLRYDPEHSEKTEPKTIDNYWDSVRHGSYITAQTRSGATYNRVQGHQKVVKLGLETIESHIREVVRDIAVGDEANHINAILKNKEVRAAFQNTGNAAHLRTMELWLVDAAVGELPSESPVDAMIGYLRSGFVKAKLGINISTIFLQFTGLAQTVAVVGPINYLRGIKEIMLSPSVFPGTMKKSKFLEARYSTLSFNKDVADTKDHLEAAFGPAPTGLKQLYSRLAVAYFWGIARAQQGVDITTWIAAEHRAKADGRSDSEAILYADSIVEGAQTSGFFSDRSGLERGTLGGRKTRQSQMLRIWTTLISYMLAKGNIAYEKGVAVGRIRKKHGGFSAEYLMGATRFLADMGLLFTVEALATAILHDRWFDEDEDENLFTWGLKETGLSVLSGVPFIREAPSALYGSGATPIGALAKDSFDLTVQGMQAWDLYMDGKGFEGFDASFRREFINVTAPILHLPSSQPNKWLDYYADDDDPTAIEWFMGTRE